MKSRVLAILAALGIVTVVGVASLANAGTGPTITVPAGIATRMNAADVIASVERRLMNMSAGVPNSVPITILSVTATDAGSVDAVEPNAGIDTSFGGVVWIVRAKGTFVGVHVPPGTKPITSSTGYLLIDDATGEPMGMGMP